MSKIPRCNEPISMRAGKNDHISFYCVKKHYHIGDHKWRIRVKTPCKDKNDDIIEILSSEIKEIKLKLKKCETNLPVFNRYYNNFIVVSYFNCVLNKNHEEKHKWLIELSKPDKDLMVKGIVVDENNIKKLKSK